MHFLKLKNIKIKLFSVLILSIMFTILGGCSKLNGEKYHVTAESYQNLPSLKVPPELNKFKSENYYPIPNLPSKASSGTNVSQDKLIVPPSI